VRFKSSRQLTRIGLETCLTEAVKEVRSSSVFLSGGGGGLETLNILFGILTVLFTEANLACYSC